MLNITKSFERVPVEIWEYILRLVMDETLLLSSDPFNDDRKAFKVPDDWICPMYDIDEEKNLYWGMKDQPAMRQFRRLRALLRLVCKSWKRFADSPAIENCIVRLCVPSHPDEDIQPDLLIKAKRIELVDPRRNPNQVIEGVIKRTVEEKRIFEAEIIIDIGGLLSMQFLRKHPTNFPYLTSLHVDLTNPSITTFTDYEFDGIFTKLPNLGCLSVRLDKRLILPVNDFRLLNLVSLSLSSTSLQGLSFGMWRTPKLRHLKLDGMRCPTHPARFSKYVWRFGTHLTYLSLTPDYHIGSWDLSMSVIWTHCPNIVHLEIPLHTIRREITLPPKGWPLTHLVNTSTKPLACVDFDQPGLDFMTFYGHMITFCLSCRMLKVITDAHVWLDVMFHVYAPLRKNSDEMPPDYYPSKAEQATEDTANATIILARKLEMIHIRYEDKERKSHGEATAFRG